MFLLDSIHFLPPLSERKPYFSLCSVKGTKYPDFLESASLVSLMLQNAAGDE